MIGSGGVKGDDAASGQRASALERKVQIDHEDEGVIRN